MPNNKIAGVTDVLRKVDEATYNFYTGNEMVEIADDETMSWGTCFQRKWWAVGATY